MSALFPAARRPAPDRASLVEHLMRTRMAGIVATPRENNLLHYQLLADRDPYYQLGLEPAAHWTRDSVLDLMARKVGVSPRLDHRSGEDTIDPDRTVDALDRYADRFGEALRERQRVLFATGHPNNLSELYQQLASALAAAGGRVVEAADGWSYDAPARHGGRKRLEIRYFLGVAMVEDPGGPVHSHAARPIRAVLAELAAAGGPMPDLVVADHGWCGGAGQAGLDAIGFADCNDPALFVGEEEGAVQVAVPLDDGLDPDSYSPLGDYILARAAQAA
ncbi:MAG TPA: phosphatase [Actinocrinis sp.]